MCYLRIFLKRENKEYSYSESSIPEEFILPFLSLRQHIGASTCINEWFLHPVRGFHFFIQPVFASIFFFQNKKPSLIALYTVYIAHISTNVIELFKELTGSQTLWWNAQVSDDLCNHLNTATHRTWKRLRLESCSVLFCCTNMMLTHHLWKKQKYSC